MSQGDLAKAINQKQTVVQECEFGFVFFLLFSLFSFLRLSSCAVVCWMGGLGDGCDTARSRGDGRANAIGLWCHAYRLLVDTSVLHHSVASAFLFANRVVWSTGGQARTVRTEGARRRRIDCPARVRSYGCSNAVCVFRRERPFSIDSGLASFWGHSGDWTAFAPSFERSPTLFELEALSAVESRAASLMFCFPSTTFDARWRDCSGFACDTCPKEARLSGICRLRFGTWSFPSAGGGAFKNDYCYLVFFTC